MPDLVFKTRRTEPFPVEVDGMFVVAGLAGLLRSMPLLWQWSTVVERARLALKVVAGRSVFFGIESSGRLVSSGVLALGYCGHYDVEPDAVVIGTVLTDSAHRGGGLATLSVKGVMNEMIARRRTLFYIDTQKENKAMLRLIEKLGFGPPVSGREQGIRACCQSVRL